jgi:hypothetical protein
MNKHQQNKGAMSVNDFMTWASIGRTKFYQEVNAGRLSIRKIGKKTVVRYSDAIDWLNALPEMA